MLYRKVAYKNENLNNDLYFEPIYCIKLKVYFSVAKIDIEHKL